MKSSKLKRMHSSSILLLLAAAGTLYTSRTSHSTAHCAKLTDIYWNSSNPIFRIDNTDHIFDVNKRDNDHDQVDLICPQTQTSAHIAPSSVTMMQSLADQGINSTALTINRTTTTTTTTTSATSTTSTTAGSPDNSIAQERYIIYSVSKEEYDTCRLNGNGARPVALCDQQQGKNRLPFTITFRSYSPQPNGLEFLPGQDYYFISALPGQHLDPSRRFSPCREQNMKVIFKVCCKGQQPPPSRGPLKQPPQQVASTRRPSPVVTIRPSLKPQPSAAPAPVAIPPDPFAFGGPFGGSPGQQQQPVTVLPIEVTEGPAPASSGHQDPAMNSMNSDMAADQSPSQQTDIVQNEQPTTVSPPQPQPPPHLRLRGPQQSRLTPFVPFDPRAPPETLRSLSSYRPTPLPPAITDRIHYGVPVAERPAHLPWQMGAHQRVPTRDRATIPESLVHESPLITRQQYYPNFKHDPQIPTHSPIAQMGMRQTSGSRGWLKPGLVELLFVLLCQLAAGSILLARRSTG